MTKKCTKKSTQPRKNLSFAWKNVFFFYSKRPPSLAKNWNFAWKNDKKMTKKGTKKSTQPRKIWYFAWKKSFFLLKKATHPRKKLKFCKKITFSPIPAKKWSFAWNPNRRRIVQGKKGPRRNQGKHCIESSNTEFGKTKAQGTRAVAYCKRTDYNGKRKRVAAIPDWRNQIPKRKDVIRSWMINNPESALC